MRETWKPIFGSTLLTILLVFTQAACGDDGEAPNGDVGVDADQADTDHDDTDVNDGGEELWQTGDPCPSCSQGPGTNAICDSCEGEWCYHPSTVGEEAYCSQLCNDDEDCEKDGWSCSSLGCERD